MNKVWISVGAACELARRQLYTPSIRSYRERHMWDCWIQSRNCSRVAIYNSGHQLHIDPCGLPATSYYGAYAWQWLRFRDFVLPAHILASDRKIAGFLNDIVPIQHHGHGLLTRGAQISVGEPNNGKMNNGLQRKFFIPPMCILYVAVRYGRVMDSLTVGQPLPQRLFPTNEALRVQKQDVQYIVATGK